MKRFVLLVLIIMGVGSLPYMIGGVLFVLCAIKIVKSEMDD